jgi:hypothetical protein
LCNLTLAARPTCRKGRARSHSQLRRNQTTDEQRRRRGVIIEFKIEWKDGAPRTNQPRTPLISQLSQKVTLPAKLSVQCSAAPRCLIGAASLSGHRVVVRLRVGRAAKATAPRPLPSLLLLPCPVASPSKSPATPSSSSLHLAFRPRSRFGQSLRCCGGERRFPPFFFAGELDPSRARLFAMLVVLRMCGRGQAYGYKRS